MDLFEGEIKRNENSNPERYIQQYLSDERIGFDIFLKYKNLKELFIKYNTSLPSSAPSECLFSMARKCFNYSRTKLTDENFEAQILLKVNKFKKKKRD